VRARSGELLREDAADIAVLPVDTGQIAGTPYGLNPAGCLLSMGAPVNGWTAVMAGAYAVRMATRNTNLDLEAVRALVAVAERRSIQAAAKELGVSRATVRRRLEELEGVVGVPLIHRDAQRLRMTRAGQVLVERSRQLVERASEAVLEARHAATQAGGLVRIGLAPGMPESIVTQLLLGIQGADLGVRISLEELHDPISPELPSIDLMFHFGPPPETDDWYSRVLRRPPARLMASPEYLAARGVPEDADTLRRHRLLVWRGPVHATDHLPLRAGGSVRVSPWLVSPDVSLLRRLASAGGGIAFAPDGDIPDDPGIGALVPVLEDVVGRSEVFRVTSLLPSRADPRAAEFAQRVFEMFRDLPES